MNRLLEITFGSHLYGTATEESDLDLKSIYLPNHKELILGTYKDTIVSTRPKQKFERNKKDDIDVEIFSLNRYLKLLSDGQLVAIDMLFASNDKINYLTDVGWTIWQKILCNKEKILCKNVASFIGYAKKQSARYGIKGSRLDALKRTKELLDTLPNNDRLEKYDDLIMKLISHSGELVSLESASLIRKESITLEKGVSTYLIVCERKLEYRSTVKHAKDIVQKILDEYGRRAHLAHLAQGKDWKALHHAVRVANQAIELLTTGHITFPIKDAKYLTDIKRGLIPYEEVQTLIEQGLVDLMEAQKNSVLRETPDYDWIDNFIYEVYSNIE